MDEQDRYHKLTVGLRTEVLPDGTVRQNFRDAAGKFTTEVWDVKASQADAAIRQKLIDLGWTPPTTHWPEHGVQFATVRDAEDELHVECRFRDGQKFAAVKVDCEHPELAFAIAQFLSLGRDQG